MTDLPRNDEQFRSWLCALRRRWMTVAAITILATAGIGFYTFGKQPTYSSTAEVLIQPLTGNALTPEVSTSDQNLTVALETEANIVNSATVTMLVGKAVGSRYGRDLSAVGAKVSPNTQLIVITYHARSAGKARSVAQAYARAYLRYRHNLAVSFRTAALSTLDDQVSATQRLFTAASAAAVGLHSAVGASSEKSLYASRLASLQTQIGEAQAQLVDPGSIIVPASVPTTRTRLLPALLTLAAALLSFLIGCALAALLERRADRVSARTNADAARVRLLATVPVAPGDRPNSAASALYFEEAYRRARIGLVSATPTGSVVAMSAVSPIADAAAVAVAVACSLADAGFRVTLIDAAISEPQVGELLDVGPVTGLSDAVIDGQPVGRYSHEVDGLAVVPAGTQLERARGRYSNRVLVEAFAAPRITSDYVLVVTPPLSTAYGLSVLQAVEHVVLIGADEQTRVQAIHQASDTAEGMGVAVSGLLLSTERHGPAGFAPPRSRAAERVRTEPTAHVTYHRPAGVATARKMRGPQPTSGASPVSTRPSPAQPPELVGNGPE